MILTGVVREFHADQGWGVLDAPEVPGGCWVHFSAIEMPGHRSLTPGRSVRFVAEPARQDGYDHRAVRVWDDRGEPPVQDHSPSTAYRSELTLTFDVPPDR